MTTESADLASHDQSWRMGYRVRELTLGRVLAGKAATHGTKQFLHSLADGRMLSYADVDRASNRLANGLLALGIRSGDSVAVLMDNSAEQLLLFFALGKIGAVNAPINNAAKGDMLRRYLDLSCAVAVVVDSYLLSRLQEVVSASSQLRRIVVFGSNSDTAQAAPHGTDDFRVLTGFPDTPPDIAVQFDDIAMLTFTSGTTGPSKAAVYTHAAILQGAIACAEAWGYKEDDVYYVCLPFFHSNAVRASTYVALILGASVALARRFSASHFWEDVRESKATTFNLLGSMLNILWAQPESARDREHSVRICRAVPMPAVADEFEARFNIKLVTTYGLSDFGTPVAFTTADPKSKRGSAGRAQRGWTVRIVDADDFDVAPGDRGEIVLRSERMWAHSSGYFGMPAATVAAMRNGWFHTGDIGYLDRDGYLWYVGRMKDSIRRRGENISAWEVEQVILSHPAVAEAAVYAAPSEMSEDEVAASVILKPGTSISESDLVKYCSERMAYFMVPRFIAFVDDLPRTLSLKVQKSRLIELAQKALTQFWDREKAGVRLQR